MAIIPGKGWAARFKHEEDGKARRSTETVVLWREYEDGDVVGLILDDNSKLRPASSFSNFDGYEPEEEPAHFVPATAGWWSVSRLSEADGGGGWWAPIAAWRFDESGYTLEALPVPDSDDYCEPMKAGKGVQFVYAPEHTKPGRGNWPEQTD